MSDQIELFITRIKKDSEFRESLIDSLCLHIKDSSEFRDMLEYVIDNKLYLFDIDEFKDTMYEEDEDDEIITLVLPCIRRVYAKVFIHYPDIFKIPVTQEKMPQIWTQSLKPKIEKKLELYQLYFDIDDFVEYLLDMFKKSKYCLKEFEHLDRTKETLSLIVDNYIASLIQKVQDCQDIQKELRDQKLKKLIKK